MLASVRHAEVPRPVEAHPHFVSMWFGNAIDILLMSVAGEEAQCGMSYTKYDSRRTFWHGS